VDSIFFCFHGGQRFLGDHRALHRRTKNPIKHPIHPTANARGLSRAIL
jgi:hypothetical protein